MNDEKLNPVDEIVVKLMVELSIYPDRTYTLLKDAIKKAMALQCEDDILSCLNIHHKEDVVIELELKAKELRDE